MIKETLRSSVRNTNINIPHQVTDLRKSILLAFYGLMEDRLSDIMSPPVLNSRSTEAVVAGMQWIIRANFNNNGKSEKFAFQNTRGLSRISSGAICIDKYLSTSFSASPYSSLSSPDSYS
jgi:hypothetical protein